MAQTRVVVIGGTGFLGRAIVRHLALSGQPVRVAARHPATPAMGGTHAEIELHPVDIQNDLTVAYAMDGASAVVNAVGLYTEQGEQTFEAVHVKGAARVARRARQHGVQLVHISGIGADPESASRYVAARGRGEAAVQAEHPEAIIVRPSVLFGPGAAFLHTLEKVTRLPVVPLFGNGRTRLQPVHVDDVAAAVGRFQIPPLPAGNIFELGGGRVYTYREIVEMVLSHLDRRRVLLPVPFNAWRVLANLGSMLPNAPLTKDQVILMQNDNVAGNPAGGFNKLGIEPRSLGDELAACLP